MLGRMADRERQVPRACLFFTRLGGGWRVEGLSWASPLPSSVLMNLCPFSFV